MNPRATPDNRPDLDAALFSFADEHARDAVQAVYRLQVLLLDEDTCLPRVALLRALTGRNSTSAASSVLALFAAEVDLICQEGLLAAHAAGRLTQDRVQRLDRLTRDPDALLEVHRRLVGDQVDAPGRVVADTAANVLTAAAPETALPAPATSPS